RRARPPSRTPGGGGGVVKPGEPVQVTLTLYPTSNLFMPGHRIRLDVSSSNPAVRLTQREARAASPLASAPSALRSVHSRSKEPIMRRVTTLGLSLLLGLGLLV